MKEKTTQSQHMALKEKTGITINWLLNGYQYKSVRTNNTKNLTKKTYFKSIINTFDLLIWSL